MARLKVIIIAFAFLIIGYFLGSIVSKRAEEEGEYQARRQLSQNPINRHRK